LSKKLLPPTLVQAHPSCAFIPNLKNRRNSVAPISIIYSVRKLIAANLCTICRKLVVVTYLSTPIFAKYHIPVYSFIQLKLLSLLLNYR